MLEAKNFLIANGRKNTNFSGEQKLLLTVFVLVLQDLNMEEHFLSLKEYFILPKKKNKDIVLIKQALAYIYFEDLEGEEYGYSFSNFCQFFSIEISLLRNLIKKYIRQERGIVWTALVALEEEYEERIGQEEGISV